MYYPQRPKEYPFHIEVPNDRGEPIDVRLADNFKTSSKCRDCGKTIYRGKTKNGKSMPVSMTQINSYGDKGPIAHWNDCTRKK